MEPKIIRQGDYNVPQDNGSLKLKTRYFPDGSAIIVAEKSICLVERESKYEVHPRDRESAPMDC